jgi:hypothetical protein
MIIMILELLAVSFVLGMFITAVVLGGLSAVDAMRRATRQPAGWAASRSARPVSVLQPRHRQAHPGQPHAA